MNELKEWIGFGLYVVCVVIASFCLGDYVVEGLHYLEAL